MTLPMPHGMAHPGEFWSPASFGLHPTLLPSSHMLHPNLIPNYKIPNIHAAIMQYMGLNSLFNGDRGSYSSPQNLSINTSATTRSNSPQTSPVESPSKDLEK